MFALQEFERQHYPVAGVDEVGRGCLFGAVIAAAVILPPDCYDLLASAGVTDSKRLSAARRVELEAMIRGLAVDCRIGMASVAEIDRLNILQASLLAMERAIAQLVPLPRHCLIDGNQLLRFRELAPLPQTTVVKGDLLSPAIAAASIVAKVWRDRAIVELAREYPGYDLERNKGYGTARHREAIRTLGLTDLHRQSFCH